MKNKSDNNTENYMYINNNLYGVNDLLYHINRAGSGLVNHDFYIERNSSYPYSVIHYVIEGSGQVVCRGKRYPVKKGQCFILNSFEGHSYGTNPEDALRLGWIEFSGGDSAKLIAAFLNDNLPVIDGKQSKVISKYILKILVFLRNEANNCEIIVSRIIYAIMLQLLMEYKSCGCSQSPNSKIDDIKKVVEYIDNNLGCELSVEQLAKVLNYNPQYFARLFQKHMGMPPARYIMTKRISAAKKSLSTEDIKIDILADQLGFANASHLIRKFKKAEGITPAQFRKESLSYYNEKHR